MSTYSFTGNKVSFTYQRLLQISDGGDGNPTGIIYDGFGATVSIADENINNLYTTVNNLITNGIAGSTGSTGVQGWQGPIGLTGESITGAQGAYGPTGFQGNTGPQGYQGYQGSQGDGITGVQGNTGPQGYQGNTGPQGFQGSGLGGETGPQGLIGPTGFQGNTGVQGPIGPGGSGSIGATGYTGPQGLIGPTGVQGPQGLLGVTGPQGDFGPQGLLGVTGPQGFGFQGFQGNGFIWRGIFDSGYFPPYNTNDVVYYEGSSYICINTPTSISPPPYEPLSWSLIALGSQDNGSQGSQGPQGIGGGSTGPQGIIGSIGSTGSQGRQGLTGPQGLGGGSTGPQGNIGPQGIGSGSTGPQGIIGSIGSTGSQGRQGLTGPQGLGGGSTGPQGNIGPQGIGSGSTGPQGNTGSSFIFTYPNIAFVHPDGNDSTAVIGNFSLPFASITGAYGSVKSKLNPVIEVWSGANFILGTNSSSSIYDYTIDTTITIDSSASFNSITIHLKSGVHIYFQPTTTGSALFDILGKTLKITSEDSYSSFHVNNGYFSNISLDKGNPAELYLENLLIDVKPLSENPNSFGSSIILNETTCCYAKNVKFEVIDTGENNMPYLSIFRLKDTSRLEIYDCQLKNISYGNSSTTCKNSIFILEPKNEPTEGEFAVLEIKNSQTVQLITPSSYVCDFYVFYCDCGSGKSAYISIDDCVFWLDPDASSDKYVLYESNNKQVDTSLISRSIHNYRDTYNTSWSFTTGIDQSQPTLGVAGFGFLENYSIFSKPFIW